MKKPRIIFQVMPAGQTKEDFIGEMKAKHGGGDCGHGGMTVMDASDMDPGQLENMLAGMGISKEEFDTMTKNGDAKKKPGFFQRIQDAILK
jgi:hypothetical protein